MYRVVRRDPGPLLVVMILVVFAATACTHPAASAQARADSGVAAGRASPTVPRASNAPLSARIVLPATRIAAGSTMAASARLVVSNRTGHPILVSSCGSPFAIALHSPEVRQSIAWPLCLERVAIPRGTSSWRVTVSASYTACGDGRNTVPCVHGYPPPLPAGAYRAVLVQIHPIVPQPAPVAVVVTAP